MAWLSSAVSSLRNKRLKLVLAQDFPSFYVLHLDIPNQKPAVIKNLHKILKTENPTLQCGLWDVVCNTIANKTRQFVFSIAKQCIVQLERENFIVKFMGKSYVVRLEIDEVDTSVLSQEKVLLSEHLGTLGVSSDEARQRMEVASFNYEKFIVLVDKFSGKQEFNFFNNRLIDCHFDNLKLFDELLTNSTELTHSDFLIFCHKSFPNTFFNSLSLDQIKIKFEEFLKQSPVKLAIGQICYEEGWLKVHYGNEVTLKWLKRVTLFTGSPLKLLSKNEMPHFFFILLKVQLKSYDNDVMLKNLESENGVMNTLSWNIARRVPCQFKASDFNKEMLTIVMDAACFQVLRNNGFRVKYLANTYVAEPYEYNPENGLSLVDNRVEGSGDKEVEAKTTEESANVGKGSGDKEVEAKATGESANVGKGSGDKEVEAKATGESANVGKGSGDKEVEPKATGESTNVGKMSDFNLETLGSLDMFLPIDVEKCQLDSGLTNVDTNKIGGSVSTDVAVTEAIDLDSKSINDESNRLESNNSDELWKPLSPANYASNQLESNNSNELWKPLSPANYASNQLESNNSNELWKPLSPANYASNQLESNNSNELWKPLSPANYASNQLESNNTNELWKPLSPVNYSSNQLESNNSNEPLPLSDHANNKLESKKVLKPPSASTSKQVESSKSSELNQALIPLPPSNTANNQLESCKTNQIEGSNTKLLDLCESSSTSILESKGVNNEEIGGGAKSFWQTIVQAVANVQSKSTAQVLCLDGDVSYQLNEARETSENTCSSSAWDDVIVTSSHSNIINNEAPEQEVIEINDEPEVAEERWEPNSKTIVVIEVQPEPTITNEELDELTEAGQVLASPWVITLGDVNKLEEKAIDELLEDERLLYEHLRELGVSARGALQRTQAAHTRYKQFELLVAGASSLETDEFTFLELDIVGDHYKNLQLFDEMLTQPVEMSDEKYFILCHDNFPKIFMSYLKLETLKIKFNDFLKLLPIAPAIGQIHVEEGWLKIDYGNQGTLKWFKRVMQFSQSNIKLLTSNTIPDFRFIFLKIPSVPDNEPLRQLMEENRWISMTSWFLARQTPCFPANEVLTIVMDLASFGILQKKGFNFQYSRQKCVAQSNYFNFTNARACSLAETYFESDQSETIEEKMSEKVMGEKLVGYLCKMGVTFDGALHRVEIALSKYIRFQLLNGNVTDEKFSFFNKNLIDNKYEIFQLFDEMLTQPVEMSSGKSFILCHKNFPNTFFNSTDLRFLQKKLIDFLNNLPVEPAIGTIFVEEGWLKIYYGNDGAFNFIKEIIETVDPNVFCLKLLTKYKIPEFQFMIIRVPTRTLSDDVILRFLKEENVELNTDSWRVARRISQGKSYEDLAISMDSESCDILQNNESHVKYFSNLYEAKLFKHSAKLAPITEANDSVDAANYKLTQYLCGQGIDSNVVHFRTHLAQCYYQKFALINEQFYSQRVKELNIFNPKLLHNIFEVLKIFNELLTEPVQMLCEKYFIIGSVNFPNVFLNNSSLELIKNKLSEFFEHSNVKPSIGEIKIEEGWLKVNYRNNAALKWLRHVVSCVESDSFNLKLFDSQDVPDFCFISASIPFMPYLDNCSILRNLHSHNRSYNCANWRIARRIPFGNREDVAIVMNRLSFIVLQSHGFVLKFGIMRNKGGISQDSELRSTLESPSNERVESETSAVDSTTEYFSMIFKNLLAKAHDKKRRLNNQGEHSGSQIKRNRIDSGGDRSRTRDEKDHRKDGSRSRKDDGDKKDSRDDKSRNRIRSRSRDKRHSRHKRSDSRSKNGNRDKSKCREKRGLKSGRKRSSTDGRKSRSRSRGRTESRDKKQSMEEGSKARDGNDWTELENSLDGSSLKRGSYTSQSRSRSREKRTRNSSQDSCKLGSEELTETPQDTLRSSSPQVQDELRSSSSPVRPNADEDKKSHLSENNAGSWEQVDSTCLSDAESHVGGESPRDILISEQQQCKDDFLCSDQSKTSQDEFGGTCHMDESSGDISGSEKIFIEASEAENKLDTEFPLESETLKQVSSFQEPSLSPEQKPDAENSIMAQKPNEKGLTADNVQEAGCSTQETETEEDALGNQSNPSDGLGESKLQSEFTNFLDELKNLCNFFKQKISQNPDGNINPDEE